MLFSDESVTLAPRNWVANAEVTGGNFPSQSILISREYWVELGKPGSIEEYWEKVNSLKDWGKI